MAQQYRHIIPSNPEGLVCNHNLFDLSSETLSRAEQSVLVALLNSTLVGLWKTFYGRYAGTEGNLKTEVIDVNLIDIPDPRLASPAVAKRLTKALRSMCKRTVGCLVEEALMECHSYPRALELASRPIELSDELRQEDRVELDAAVFELLGVESHAEQRELVDKLHDEVALHFRAVRVLEIQKMEDRSKGGRSTFDTMDLAGDVWDALNLNELQPLAEWLQAESSTNVVKVHIPTERPATYDPNNIFDSGTVYFGRAKKKHLTLPSQGSALLARTLADLGYSGDCVLPQTDFKAKDVLERLIARNEQAVSQMATLIRSRTGETGKADEVLNILTRWFLFGRRPATPIG